MFSCEIYEQLLLEPVLFPRPSYLLTYSSGSSWYICFIVCNIIYCFSWRLFLHFYIQKQSSDGFLQKMQQISQNLQENTCAKESLLMKLQIYRV